MTKESFICLRCKTLVFSEKIMNNKFGYVCYKCNEVIQKLIEERKLKAELRFNEMKDISNGVGFPKKKDKYGNYFEVKKKKLEDIYLVLEKMNSKRRIEILNMDWDDMIEISTTIKKDLL